MKSENLYFNCQYRREILVKMSNFMDTMRWALETSKWTVASRLYADLRQMRELRLACPCAPEHSTPREIQYSWQKVTPAYKAALERRDRALAAEEKIRPDFDDHVRNKYGYTSDHPDQACLGELLQ